MENGEARGQSEGVGGRGRRRDREMAAGDLTVIRDSRTGSHKGDERGCRRDEKVTRDDDKKLQPRLKVTAGNLDGGQWQIASLPSPTPLRRLKTLQSACFLARNSAAILSPKRGGKVHRCASAQTRWPNP